MQKYIHQRPNWTNFVFDESVILPLLARVSRRQGRFLGRIETLGLAARNQAEIAAVTDEIVQTSAIEGETLPEDQVRSSVARQLGFDAAGLPTPDRKTDGVVRMMMDAIWNDGTPLTDERLFGWHHALFPTGWSDHGRITVADWRKDEKGPMQVISGPVGRNRVHYEAPAAELVSGEMRQFFHWYNNPPANIDPILRAALAHLWFVTIHPFDDGNGRLARAIGASALAVADRCPQRFYSLSAQIFRERSVYYDVLEKTQSQDDSDMTGWYDWFLCCLDRALEDAEAASSLSMIQQMFWDALPPADYTERQREILRRLLDGFTGKFTTQKWAKIAKISPDSAHRDIRYLIVLGLLEQEEAGGRSTSYRLGVKPMIERLQAEVDASAILSRIAFVGVADLGKGNNRKGDMQPDSATDFHKRFAETAIAMSRRTV